MEGSYILKEDSEIWIYGCGQNGSNILDQMRGHFRVKGFIDRRNIKEFRGVPVVNIDSNLLNSDSVIVISLANGMDHEAVAYQLFMRGISRIIMTPMHVNKSYCERQIMRKQYKYFLSGMYNQIGNIPYWNPRKERKNGIKIIEYNKKSVSLWYPVSLISIGDTEMIESSKIYDSMEKLKMKRFFGINLAEFTPYRNLFRWLDGEDVDIDLYLMAVGRRNQKEGWLESRKELYLIYNDALKHDTSFFSDAPSPCYLKNEKLVIQEGVTRAFFLIYKGYETVPIIVSTSDFHVMNEGEQGYEYI